MKRRDGGWGGGGGGGGRSIEIEGRKRKGM